MEKKTTIKELATELGTDTSAMIRELKQLDIAAKSSTSTLDEEEVSRVRVHYTKEQTVSSVSSDGGVIVRRRRSTTQAKENVDSKVNPPEEKSPKKQTPPLETQVEAKASPAKPKAQAEPKPSVAKAKVPAETEKPKKEAPKNSEPTKPKERIKKETPVARIIKPAPSVKQEVPTPKPEVTPVVKEEPAKQVAKVEVPAVVKEKPKAQKPVQNEEAKAPQAATKQNAQKIPSEKNTTDRKKSASMSAKPDGTSTKSILPPAGERSFAHRVESSYSEPRSQVRVISKPAPNTYTQNNTQGKEGRPQGQRPDRGDRPQGQRPDRGDRPQGQRPDRGDRPQGQRPDRGDRPQGQRRDGAFPNKDTDSRPQRPSTPRPQRPSSEVVPFPTEEQSRKKRNKNKKSGDFSENTPQQDFKFSKYAVDNDYDDAPRRRRKAKKKEVKTAVTTAPMKAAKRKIRIEEAIRVADMAHQMGLKSSEIIKVLFGLGVMATINSSLDFDTAGVVAAEFEYEVEKVGFSAEEAILPTTPDTEDQLKPRPPVVTIMGHVDHGKTSLLDAIRQTNVTAGEAGGITQHIGAYHVRTKRGEVVFLDTPGHEAFTAMRLRGAQVTDIVVLVVAADDGVMEQTREAINHAKAADVPIIVAVNKMDKEGANPDRVLRELAELGLQAESWGGDVVTTMLSAKKREGIDELLELILLQAELMELKANPDKPARGHIVEAKLDKGRGPVATVLIQEGTLNQGDSFVCGVFAGRVRALFNDQGKKIQKAGPSIPVEVQGFEGVPEAGEEFVSLQDEKIARRIADARAIKQREKVLAKESKVTLETFLARRADSEEALVLNLILKADVQGSLEAITEALNKLSTEKVRISVIHGGAGSISESDIMLAAASEAIIIGFNVRPTAKVKDIAESEHVDIRFYDIIYKLVEEIRAAMAGLLAPVQREVYLGQAEVRDVFTLSRVGTIAGSYVNDGKMLRNAGIRLLREGVVIYTGKISSLKRFKDDAKEVLKGFECGISLENYNDIKTGDIIEAFEMKEEADKL